MGSGDALAGIPFIDSAPWNGRMYLGRSGSLHVSTTPARYLPLVRGADPQFDKRRGSFLDRRQNN
jgi:hypothetical protein